MKSLTSKTSRRKFLVGAGATAGTGMVLQNSSMKLAFATPNTPSIGDTVIQIFLGGGADQFFITPPISDAHVASLGNHRTYLQIQPENALPLTSEGNDNVIFSNGFDGLLGFHPDFAPLYNGAWAKGNVAVFAGSGMPDYESGSRSHFRMTPYTQLGGNNSQVTSGWMTRLMDGAVADGPVPGVAMNGALGNAYRGATNAVGIDRLASYGLLGFRDNRSALGALDEFYQGTGQIESVGNSALASFNNVASADPNGGSNEYPSRELAADLKDVANLLRSDAGLTTAAINHPKVGHWDTHNAQIPRWGRWLNDLAPAIQAFVDDVGEERMKEVTICVMSEFGRQTQQAGNGTDHGRGGFGMAIGGSIQGGVFGYDYPSTYEPEEIGNALPVLVDYRKWIDEIIVKRTGVTGVFPTMRELPDLGHVRQAA